NDNVLAREVDPEEDVAAVLDATVRLASTWRRHALGGAIAMDALGYQDLDSDNEFNYSGRLDGRVDFARASSLFGSIFGGKLTERRDAANFNPDAVSPVDYTRTEGEVGATFALTRTRLIGSALWRSFEYNDVALIDGSVLD